MGFWSDTRQLISATGGALAEGMELLAQGASELEQATHRLSLESKIRLHEQQRARLGEGWFYSSNTDKHQELLDAYAELIREFPNESTNQFRAQLAQLHADRRALTVKNQVEIITALNERVKFTNYRLAINAISARTRLISLLEELLKIGSEEEHARLLERTSARIEELKGDITELEPRRKTKDQFQYASGAVKTKTRRYDGKLSGTYEYWYENGKPRWRIPFSAGQIVGKVERWREDGSTLLEADFANDMQSFRVYSPDSQLLAKVKINRTDVCLALCFTELNGVTFRCQLGRRPSKIQFALKVLRTPRLLKFIWRARNPGIEADRAHDIATLGTQIDQAIEELLAIRKAS